MSRKPIIFCDMDEVLVDFVGGALQVHSMTREELDAKRKPGTWEISDIVCNSMDEFWEPINVLGKSFWTRLQPLPWVEELVKILEPYEWYIVSTPSRNPESGLGKQLWCMNYFGSHFDRLIPTKHKHLLAGPNKYLIDDREKNCHKFTASGGRSLLFPSMGNRLHPWASNPLLGLKSHYLFGGERHALQG